MDSVGFKKYLEDNYFSNAPDLPYTFVVKKKLSAEVMQEQPERPSEEDEGPTYSRRELVEWAKAHRELGVNGKSSSADIRRAMQQSERMSDEEDTTVDTSREAGDVYIYLEFDIRQELKIDVMDTPATITANKSTRGKENSVEVARGIQVGDTPTIQDIVDTLALGDRWEANVVSNKTWFYERSWINYFFQQWLYTKKKSSPREDDDVSGDFNSWFDNFSEWLPTVFEGSLSSILQRIVETNAFKYIVSTFRYVLSTPLMLLPSSIATQDDVDLITLKVDEFIAAQQHGDIESFYKRLSIKERGEGLSEYQDKISKRCRVVGYCSEKEKLIINEITRFIKEYINNSYTDDRFGIKDMEYDITNFFEPKIGYMCKYLKLCDSSELLVKQVITLIKEKIPGVIENIRQNEIEQETERLSRAYNENAPAEFTCHPIVIYDLLHAKDSVIAKVLNVRREDAFKALFFSPVDVEQMAAYFNTLTTEEDRRMILTRDEPIELTHYNNVKRILYVRLHIEYFKSNREMLRIFNNKFEYLIGEEGRQGGMEYLYPFIYLEEYMYNRSFVGKATLTIPFGRFLKQAKYEEFTRRFEEGELFDYGDIFVQQCINQLIEGQSSMLDIFNKEINIKNPVGR